MPTPLVTPLSATALAFRGYNQTNLGRTPELLEVPAYREVVERRLVEASRLCESATRRRVDLVSRVSERIEPGLDKYDEAIALVFAAELAQLDLLEAFHGYDFRKAKAAYGYSLGELTAVAALGAYRLADVMRIPLSLSAECAALADGATMGVVFSRKEALDERSLLGLCEELTAEGVGAIGVSAILSPNTILVIGQGDLVQRLASRLKAEQGPRVHVRVNAGVWPPLHTPLVRSCHVPDRASLLMRDVPRLGPPAAPIWSLVTGEPEYAADSGREVLRRWADSPQRLWDVVERTFASDVRSVMHVGPAPNVIPATFQRLADNVAQQTGSWSVSGVGMRTMQLANRTWLAHLLPKEGSLLRATELEHVVLEDWLIANAPE